MKDRSGGGVSKNTFLRGYCILYIMGSEQSYSSRTRGRHHGHGHGHGHGHSHWSASAPKTVGDRGAVLSKCGRRCFLGPGKSFPICARLDARGTRGAGTCKIDRRGVQAAYSRAREWASITARKKGASVKAARAHRKYTAIARRAKILLSKIKK